MMLYIFLTFILEAAKNNAPCWQDAPQMYSFSPRQDVPQMEMIFPFLAKWTQ